MGTQSAIAQQIVGGNADYVLALKGNQGSLHQSASDDIETLMQTDFTQVDARRHTTTETKHGRMRNTNICAITSSQDTRRV